MQSEFLRRVAGLARFNTFGSASGKRARHVPRRAQRGSRVSANGERLEMRSLLTASSLVISEFMAINNSGLKDKDGAYSDWIEIRNLSSISQNLGGWHLTDNDNNLSKWTFPAVTVPGSGYLVVFASGKNLAVAGSELHTNFSLSGGGEYLALVQPDGITIATEFTPAYPQQINDVSYGITQDVNNTQLLASGASGRFNVPAGDIGSSWTGINYDDTSWTPVSTGVGYDATASTTLVPAYVNAFGTSGTQTTNAGPLGQDFTVVTPIVVTHLGVFDSGSDGIKRTLTSQLWQRSGSTGTKLAELQFSPSSQGTLVNGNRFKPLDTPLILQPGTYSILAYGFGGSAGTPATYEPNGNELIGGPSAATKTRNDNGGMITFGSTRFGSVPNVFPTSTNPNPFFFSAATFEFSASIYANQFNTNVQTSMYNVNPSAYLRLPFTVGSLGTGHLLSLNVKYEDGFVAYLNGTEIARSTNVVGAPAWNSVSGSDRPSTQAINYQSFDVSSYYNLLQIGANVLSIQGLNSAAGSSDFLLNAELVDTEAHSTGEHFYAVATPGAANSTQFYSTVGDTKFDHDRGFYTSPFDVAITTATAGATIRYTTDGSTPTSTYGTVYTAPVHITGTTTLRAGAFLAGVASTNVDTVTYLFVDDIIRQSETTPPPGFPTSSVNNQQFSYGMDPEIVNDPLYSTLIKSSLTAIPTISIVTPTANLFDPATGIYVNPGGSGVAWERPASVELINPDGSDGFQIDAGIRIRGGFSRDGSNPKHAFKLYFGDSISGDSTLNFPLFGNEGTDNFEQVDLRTAQNYSWSFGGDPSNQMIEDRYARLTQKDMGDPYTRSRWYHLYIDGQYWGVYETQERSEASFAASYFGGDKADYDVIKVDPQSGYTIYATDGNMNAWGALYTGANALPALINDQTAAYTQYLKLQGLNPDGTRNPSYPVLLDVDNLIDYMDVIFYGGNLDAPISNFIGNTNPNNWYGVRNRNGEEGFKFFAHDSEHTLRDVNQSRVGPFPAGSNNNQSVSSPQWIHQMLMNVVEYRVRFSDHVQRDYFNGGVFTPTYAVARYTALRDELTPAMVAESARWGDSKTAVPLKQSDYLNATNAIITGHLPIRAAIVLGQLKNTTLYGSGASAPLFPTNLDAPTFSINGTLKHGGIIAPGASLTMSGAVAGSRKIYYTTDGSDPRKVTATAAAGSYNVSVSPTAIEYTGAITLNDTTRIKARILNTTTGQWSALDAPTFALDTSALRITEIMYHPAAPAAGSPYTTEEFEYIELQNTGATTIDLEGVHFTRGIDYTFPNLMLAAGQRVVIVSNADAFATLYPGVAVAGTYTGALNNGGEEITLTSALNTDILDFTYNDKWYPVTDGQGFSLVIINASAATSTWGVKESWRASQYVSGNPSLVDNGVNPGSIVVNEVLANTTSPTGDRIELKNTTALPIDISGWYLSNSGATDAELKKFKIPANTIVPAGEYVVYSEADFNSPTPGANIPFTLSLLGDSVLITSSDPSGGLGGYRESETFGASAAEVPFTRYIKSTGGKDFVAETAATFSTANAPPVIGPVVINEVMYWPLASQDEFVELYNISNAPVPLYDPANPANTWSFTQGLAFAFPTNVTLAANSYALIVAIDPAVFRAKYNVPAATQIFGPFTGLLDNSGETLQLSRPGVPQAGGVVPQIEVDRLTYNNKAPWPLQPSGNGYALGRKVSANYGNDVINWEASSLSGTPGRLNVPIDLSPPSTPNNLAATMINANRIDLNWTAATDVQTQILNYRILRNGVQIGTSLTPGYSDTTVTPGVSYSYQVSALNGDAIEGSLSTAALIHIVSVRIASSTDPTHVQVKFTAPVTAPSANNPANYTIAGATVSSAVLQPDNLTVILTTSALVDNAPYTLAVSGVAPAAPNPLAPNLQFTFFAGTGVGLRGDYYDGSNFTGALLTRTDPQVNFAWGGGSPDATMGAETFSIRWTGFVRAVYTETYTFTTTTDDGVRLWINDNLIIDKWIDQGDTDWSGSFALVAGKKYAIKMEYYENGGGATAKLAWSSLSTPRQYIPQDQLFPPPATPPKLSIGDVSLPEGNSGNKAFVFPVTLDGPNIVPVVVSYTTAGNPAGTATAGVDYLAASGNLTIPTGALSANITVQVVGDSTPEPTESFIVKLSAPSNATLLDDQGQGNILDDDTVTTSIASRKIVYNNSSFDGNSGAGGASDDAAIATDKSPLLPGGTATFSNYSSYSRGINSIVVDIANPSHAPTLADFAFKVGNNNTPAGWATAPAPLSLSVRAGAGANGSDRVEILWADGAIKNTWLQTTVSTALGLAAADVFYFGNAIGEGGGAANALVNSTDEIAARNNPRAFNNLAPITFNYDFNRDGFVNATDQIIARSNSTTVATALNLITVPAGIEGQAVTVSMPENAFPVAGLAMAGGPVVYAQAQAQASPVLATTSGLTSAPPADDTKRAVFSAWDDDLVADDAGWEMAQPRSAQSDDAPADALPDDLLEMIAAGRAVRAF